MYRLLMADCSLFGTGSWSHDAYVATANATMFSKWRRRTETDSTIGSRTGSVGQIGEIARRKFARGVDCNVKVLIRGDSKTGKSALFARLQALPFPADHVVTPQIQVANISWKYKVTSDVVKVEVWDVVDHGTPTTAAATTPTGKTALPLPEAAAGVCLDASFVDVYKGTHGVIFLFDMTKKWTFQYIERELPKVPPQIGVLILGNFRDKASERVIDADEVQALVSGLSRPPDAAEIVYGESCIAQDFGLHFVNRFLNIPYLLVHKRRLLDQLEKNKLELAAASQELEIFGLNSTEQDYDAFIEQRRKRAEAQAESQHESQAASPEPEPEPVAEGRFAKLKAAAFKRLSVTPTTSAGPSPKLPRTASRPATHGPASDKPVDVDNFVPDDDLDDDFFGDTKTPQQSQPTTPAPAPMESSDDDDGDAFNPMVAGDASDFDDDDFQPSSDSEDDQPVKAQPAKKDKQSTQKAAPDDDDDDDDFDNSTDSIATTSGPVQHKRARLTHSSGDVVASSSATSPRTDSGFPATTTTTATTATASTDYTRPPEGCLPTSSLRLDRRVTTDVSKQRVCTSAHAAGSPKELEKTMRVLECKAATAAAAPLRPIATGPSVHQLHLQRLQQLQQLQQRFTPQQPGPGTRLPVDPVSAALLYQLQQQQHSSQISHQHQMQLHQQIQQQQSSNQGHIKAEPVWQPSEPPRLLQPPTSEESCAKTGAKGQGQSKELPPDKLESFRAANRMAAQRHRERAKIRNNELRTRLEYENRRSHQLRLDLYGLHSLLPALRARVLADPRVYEMKRLGRLQVGVAQPQHAALAGMFPLLTGLAPTMTTTATATASGATSSIEAMLAAHNRAINSAAAASASPAPTASLLVNPMPLDAAAVAKLQLQQPLIANTGSVAGGGIPGFGAAPVYPPAQQQQQIYRMHYDLHQQQQRALINVLAAYATPPPKAP
eukprot:m.352504 g.352504  ORF g.352504 m.352504 type:complete len:947 (-) comp19903_c4_seq1:89-2929(-)